MGFFFISADANRCTLGDSHLILKVLFLFALKHSVVNMPRNAKDHVPSTLFNFKLKNFLITKKITTLFPFEYIIRKNVH